MVGAGGRTTNASSYASQAAALKAAITKNMWNGTAYCDGVHGARLLVLVLICLCRSLNVVRKGVGERERERERGGGGGGVNKHVA
jgi:hypothetical protein